MKIRRMRLSEKEVKGMDKKNCLVGKIPSSGVKNIKAPVSQNKKTGKSSVARGNDLRSKGGK